MRMLKSHRHPPVVFDFPPQGQVSFLFSKTLSHPDMQSGLSGDFSLTKTLSTLCVHPLLSVGETSFFFKVILNPVTLPASAIFQVIMWTLLNLNAGLQLREPDAELAHRFCFCLCHQLIHICLDTTLNGSCNHGGFGLS